MYVTTISDKTNSKVFDPRAWGLSGAAINNLAERLYEFWDRYSECFQTSTRDVSDHALDYLSGILRMTTERNFSNIGRACGQSPQNVQHFMSNSPWDTQEVLAQVREEISQTQAFATGGVLILDQSADEKASNKTAGASRQHNGRLGKVEMSQVGTFLAYANDGIWTWIDGELFLPESWLTKAMAKERARLGIPSGRTFQTKIELGWTMIQRAQAEELPFELVCFDTLYGRSTWLRRQLDRGQMIYMADVPADTLVYLNRPVVGVPPRRAEHKGRRCSKPRVLSEENPVQVRQLAQRPDTIWRRVRVRVTERGELNDEFSARRVWTTKGGEEPVQEWLVMRRDSDGRVYYGLSNASAETELERLAWGKCQRQFVECSNQQAKSETGWDELRAQKYVAWEHHLALTILATWFIAQTKLDWRQRYQRSPALKQELKVDQLPELSTANIRQLLQAVMPLPQLTVQCATDLVVEHLVNRARARKSRMKTIDHKQSPP
ncbi:MAG: IS701 family transposase [Acidobacteria bacterium]|nr:IS701 family transposase [Acidobacteriota bacterium]